jgi:pimeloyl-ACP methyl ester carboxylesterase
MMSSSATWWRIGPALAGRGFEVHALDLPAHGDAAPLGRPLDLDALLDGVAARLPDRVDLLVGHSLGAVVAAALAGRRPDVARAVVLEDPPAARGPDSPLLADGVEADAALVRSDRAELARREREGNPRWSEEDVRHSLEAIEAADAESIAAGLRGSLAWTLPDLLERVRVPVLVLAAPAAQGSFAEEGGTALRGPLREVVRALVPPHRFVVLDGGHCLHRDLPERWLDEVERFADEALGGGRGG